MNTFLFLFFTKVIVYVFLLVLLLFCHFYSRTQNVCVKNCELIVFLFSRSFFSIEQKPTESQSMYKRKGENPLSNDNAKMARLNEQFRWRPTKSENGDENRKEQQMAKPLSPLPTHNKFSILADYESESGNSHNHNVENINRLPVCCFENLD